MANVKYRPGKVEFYAPDSFERDSLYCCATADNAVAAKGVQNYVLTSNCDGALTIADCADSTAYGLANVCVSGVDTVRDSIGEIQGQIKTLSAAIEELKESAGKGLFKRYHLREGLKTLHRKYEVLG